MSKHPTHVPAPSIPVRRGKTGRNLALGTGLAALAAGVAAVPGPAQAIEPVPSLSKRVSDVRALAQVNPAVTRDILQQNRLTKVQWVNWPNWGSAYVPWHNWHNWHNWGNGFWANF